MSSSFLQEVPLPLTPSLEGLPQPSLSLDQESMRPRPGGRNILGECDSEQGGQTCILNHSEQVSRKTDGPRISLGYDSGLEEKDVVNKKKKPASQTL